MEGGWAIDEPERPGAINIAVPARSEEKSVPLIIVQYTANIRTDMTALCRKLATTLLSIRDEQLAQVYPEGGLKVMAYPATHYAVGDGLHDDHAFIYVNLRIVAGRSEAVVRNTGERIMDSIREHIEPVFSRSPIGVTFHLELQPVEKPGPIIMAYEGRHNNLRAIYGR
jgi:5-carboxymethyl-2-hydroxymuconate isomerase